jgi:hypothetical protein
MKRSNRMFDVQQKERGYFLRYVIQDLLHAVTIAAARVDLLIVFEENAVGTVKIRTEFFDRLDIHHGRPVDPAEELGIEPFLQLIHLDP